jgi:dienelactone hydrolase/predicted small lipoprotein YifL
MMSSRNVCSLLALVVGLLACGDEGALVLPRSDEAATPETPAQPVEPSETPDVTPSGPVEPAPTEDTPAATDGAGVPDPVLEPPGSAPESPDGDGNEPPAGEEPAQPPPSAEEPEPLPVEQPSEEPPEPPPAEEPSEEPEPPSGVPPVTAENEPTRESATSMGPFDVAIVTSGLRNGPDYGSQTLHVPEGAEPPLAAVAIVPGRDEVESSIRAWGPFLASHGIVALTFGTNDPGEGPDSRALALLDALETLRAENRRDGSPVEGQLALDHLGIMGWSAGGAAVLNVASSTPALRAAIVLTPFSPGGEFPEDEVPTLFLAGSADPRAGGQSQGVFESLPESTPKLLFEIEDGDHEVGNDPRNAGGEVGLYGLSWLQVFLVGDERYRPFLEETPSQASDFRASLGRAR